MNSKTSELKEILHQLVTNTNDEGILSQVQAYFSALQKKPIDWWDYLSEKDKLNIELGLSQLDNNEGHSNEIVQSKVDQLLGRK